MTPDLMEDRAQALSRALATPTKTVELSAGYWVNRFRRFPSCHGRIVTKAAPASSQLVDSGSQELHTMVRRQAARIDYSTEETNFTLGLTTLWGAAALTLITGWDYMRAGLKHPLLGWPLYHDF